MSREVINPDEIIEIMSDIGDTLPELTPLIETFNLLSDANQRLAFTAHEQEGDIFSLIAAARRPYQDINSLMIEISKEEIISLYFMAASFPELDHLLAESQPLPILGSIRYGPANMLWEKYADEDDPNLGDDFSFAVNIYDAEDMTDQMKTWRNLAMLCFHDNGRKYLADTETVRYVVDLRMIDFFHTLQETIKA